MRTNGIDRVAVRGSRGSCYSTAIIKLIHAIEEQLTTVTAETITTHSISSPANQIKLRNPYKGLRAFDARDKDEFFGRETLVSELIAVMENIYASPVRFLAVVGPSGSGKSSAVMAGLIPKLMSGAVANSDAWMYLDRILPGEHPLDELAVVLANALNSKILPIREELEMSARALHLYIRRLIKDLHRHILLFVDQFEELFTLTNDENERRAFIDSLVSAATIGNGKAIIVLTLRADFYDRPMRYPELGKLFETMSKFVLPLSVSELRSVIELPASLPDVQLKFEQGLVGDLLYDVGNQVGALPLLQFTLHQLANLHENRLMTIRAYAEIGGLKGAIAKHAEQTYQNLASDTHRELSRSLFLRLIELEESERDMSRRRANMQELLTNDPDETQIFQEIILEFTSARLLTANQYAGISTLEVSHEALLTEWPRLTEWIRTARHDISVQRSLTHDAREWSRQGKNRDDLYNQWCKLKSS